MKYVRDSLKVGDLVTTTEDTTAYYSEYAGNPTLIFKIDMVGIVKYIHCIAVRYHTYSKNEFVLVEYVDPETNLKHDVALDYKSIKLVNK